MVQEPGDVRRRDRRGADDRPARPRHRGGRRRGIGFELQITLWLWFTVLFANLAEAMAEGRGKAQADTLRKARTETIANRLDADGPDRDRAGRVAAQGRRRARAGRRVHPGDGEIVEGVASVDESAITGESAPVIREAGGDRSAVTGGTTRAVGLDQGARSLRSRADLPRSHDRAGRRRRAAEDAERDRAQHPAGGPDDRLPAGGRHAAAVCDLLRARRSRSSCWSRCWCA